MSKQPAAIINVKRFPPLVLMLALLTHGMGAGRSSVGAPPSTPAEQPTKATRRDRHGDPLPAGAVRRLGTVRLRHASGRIVAFSADSKTLTSIGSDQTMRVWDVASGRLLRTMPGPAVDDHFGWNLLCATDGTTLVSFERSPSAFVFWELATGKRRTLSWNDSRPERLGLSADGRTLAASMPGGGIHLLDAKSGKARVPPLRHQDSCRSLVFSPDGKLLAACGDPAIELWDTEGEHLRRITTPDSTLAFSPDGKWSASAGNGQTVTLRTPMTGTARHKLSLPPPDNLSRPVCLTFSPDGKYLAAGGDGRPIVVWDVASRKERYRFPVGFATVALFSPDGRILATSGDSTIRLWDLKSETELHPAEGHAGEVTAIAVSADSRIVASASWDDHTVRLWNRDTARQRCVLTGHTEYIRDVALAPDGEVLFSGGGDGTIRQWDAGSGEQQRVFSMEGPHGERQQVLALQLSSDGRTLAAVSLGFGHKDKPILWVWEALTGKERVKRTLDVQAWTFLAPDVKTFATLRDGKLVQEELLTGRRREVSLSGLQPSDPWTFSADGQLLAMRSHSGDIGLESVAVVDVKNGTVAQVVPTGAVGFQAFSPDQRYLATANRDSLRLWELATGREVLRRPGVPRLYGHFGNAFICSLAFTPDGCSLVTGLPDTTILDWSLDPGATEPPEQPTPEMLKGWWDDLGKDDGPKGYAAVWGLTRAPREKTLTFLSERLQPMPALDRVRVRKLIEELDDGQFTVRQRAFQELEKLGEDARSELRQALDDKPSVEVRKRLEDLLSRSKRLHAGSALRDMRAVEVLERLGGTELLTKLTKGAPEARMTREARTALDRLARRVKP